MIAIPRSLAAGLAFWLGIAALSTGSAQQPGEGAVVEAVFDEEQMLWSLGDQTWEFQDVETTYLPARGSYDPKTREAVWLLQIVKDMLPGEVGLHSALRGSPFQPVMLDADRTEVAGDAPVKLSPITGRMGDTVRVTIRLPDETALAKVALVRIERRTEVGF